jgi:hypothetical protein
MCYTMEAAIGQLRFQHRRLGLDRGFYLLHIKKFSMDELRAGGLAFNIR